MGFDAIKKGICAYFKKFAWKNTDLIDFVECMDEAYREIGDTSLGQDFVFKQWCDSHLITSGINILQP